MWYRTSCGSGLGRIFQVGSAMPEQRQKTIVCFCKRSCGGSPWRDLPPAFGHWNSQFRRFRRLAKSGVCEDLFKAMSEDLDLEYALIDGTIVGGHQKATRSKGASASGHWALARLGRRQRSSRWWMRSAIWFGFCCYRGKRMI